MNGKIFTAHTKAGLAVIMAPSAEKAAEILKRHEGAHSHLGRKLAPSDFREVDPEIEGVVAYSVQYASPV